jgi:hypothetical protein
MLSLSPSGRQRATAVLREADEASVVYDGPAVSGTLPQAFEWTGKGEAILLVILSDSKVDAKSIRSLADAPAGADVLFIHLRR